MLALRAMSRSLSSRQALLWLVAGAGAVCTGIVVARVSAALVAVVALLPIASHIRWVGWRGAFREPSAISVILLFYIFIFPLRGLALYLQGGTAVSFLGQTVRDIDLALVLSLAGVGTLLFTESFHAAVAKAPVRRPAAPYSTSWGLHVVACSVGVASLVALFLVVKTHGGIAGAQAVFYSHGKEAARTALSLGNSAWQTLSIPAGWFAAFVVLDRRAHPAVRALLFAILALILCSQVIIFGSRLDVLVILTGAWVFHHVLRGPLPKWVLAASVIAAIMGSIPLLSSRSGSEVSASRSFGVSTVEQLSRLTSYGVLEAAMAVRAQPEEIRAALSVPERWLAAPLYMIPAPVWPGKPRLDETRVDVLVAQNLGRYGQRNSGYPTTFMTEAWLLGGLGGLALVAIGFGWMAGALHRRTLAWHSQYGVMLNCFVIATAFTYYKDGDLLLTFTSSVRAGIYLVALLGAAALLDAARTSRKGPGVSRR